MQDDLIDAALRRAPEINVPPHFANRVVARLPRAPADPAVGAWVVPALSLAGAATLGSLAWAAASLGLGQWLMHPQVLAALLGIEAAVSLAWVWRVFRSAR